MRVSRRSPDAPIGAYPPRWKVVGATAALGLVAAGSTSHGHATPAPTSTTTEAKQVDSRYAHKAALALANRFSCKLVEVYNSPETPHTPAFDTVLQFSIQLEPVSAVNPYIEKYGHDPSVQWQHTLPVRTALRGTKPGLERAIGGILGGFVPNDAVVHSDNSTPRTGPLMLTAAYTVNSKQANHSPVDVYITNTVKTYDAQGKETEEMTGFTDCGTIVQEAGPWSIVAAQSDAQPYVLTAKPEP